jgi:hypothetical protein
MLLNCDNVLETWKKIIAIQQRQDSDPTYFEQPKMTQRTDENRLKNNSSQ